MSQYPRQVLTSVTVSGDSGRTSVLVQAGSVVDIKPGSALETVYGISNLSAVPTGQALCPEATDHLDRSGLAN